MFGLSPFRLVIVPLVVLMLALIPLTAYAHGGEDVATNQGWTWSPFSLLGMALFVGLYSSGVFRLWQNAGIGHGVRIWQVVAFAGAINYLFMALFSPIDALSDSLFSAHMGQHMLLMFAAAPLLVVSALPIALLWAIPRTWARQIGQWWIRASILQVGWQFITNPLVASILFTFSLWLWHVPSPYEAALDHELIHAIEHAAFFVTTSLFWWAIFQLNRRSSQQAGVSILYLFGALLQSGALGALLTFSQQPWYASYAQTTAGWGLTPLDDQQLGGVIMWVPGHLLFAGIMLVIAYRWLNAPQPTNPIQDIRS